MERKLFLAVAVSLFLYAGAIEAHASQPVCDPLAVAAASSAAPEQSASGRQEAADLRAASNGLHPDAVAVGDSITFGWPALPLQAALGANRLAKLGVEGDTIQNLLWRLKAPEFSAWRPARVVVLIGTNNLTTQLPACAIAEGIRSLVKRIDRLWHKPTLYIVGILPRGPGFGFRAVDIAAINLSLKDLASKRRKSHYIGVGKDISCWYVDGCRYFNRDQLHPRPEGFDLLNRAIASQNGGPR